MTGKKRQNLVNIPILNNWRRSTNLDNSRNSIGLHLFFLILVSAPFVTVLSRSISFLMLMVSGMLLAVFLARGGAGILNLKIGLNGRKSFFWLAIGGLVLLYPALSIFLTPAPDRALGAFAQVVVASTVTLTCSLAIVRGLPVPQWLRRAMSLTIILTCLLLFVEIKFDSPIRGLIGVSVDFFRVNRAIVFLVLLLPVFFIVNGNKCNFFWLSVALIVAIIAFISDSESAKLAIFVMALVAVGSKYIGKRRMFLASGIMLVVSHLFSPAIALALYTYLPLEVYEYIGIPLQHVRSEIWWAHTHAVFDSPILGHGLQSSIAAFDYYDGSNPRILTGLSYGHPHNFSIQVWFELGAVGVLLSSLVMLGLLLRAQSLRETYLGQAATLVAGVWSIAYVSHGAWQHWWWAMVGIAAILFFAAVKTNDVQMIKENALHSRRPPR